MVRVFVITGVAGSGKTTVGVALARALEVPFYDGDDFHPPENVARMAGGVPLTDEDRYPWLDRLRSLIADHLARGVPAVVACSALKQRYRDRLRAGNEGVFFIYLQGSIDLIGRRLATREGHYMKPDMLGSQFEALESPGPHDALIIDVTHTVDAIVDAIISHIRALDPPAA